MLSPVLPQLSAKIYKFLCIKPPLWEEIEMLLTDKLISTYEPLLTRIDANKIDEIKEKSKEGL